MTIRPATDADWPRLWPIVREVIRAGDTYTVEPGLDEAAARAFWTGPPSTIVTLAEAEGEVLGTAHMGPNRAGPGAHVANASYMVSAAARGRGVGRLLVEDSLRRLAAAGFQGLQFNAVAASNRGAVALYEDLGFTIIGTVPAGFRHPREGDVGLHVMYRPLP
ncbi:GNAT family N-acetyltransferase [Pseudoroseicyclus sp. CLL3-39]|uniref:GNAT family N-acetyltransferase n=1 Tax=Pseudoroseicyclus tamaricis TaxID=2705421 RepID=A0A6B2JSS3_9RHOB|nr:GNAT family N-acetyltransferase [Pseudoroseicyclus tamaricis]